MAITKLSDVYDFLYGWIDYVINFPQDIGSITVTKGSKIVVGTNFVTNNIVQANGYIRLLENYWVQVDTVDSETQLTLKENYRSVGDTDTGYYSDEGIEIIIGSQNVSSSDERYIIIHNPPISHRKIGETQVKKNESVDIGGGVLVRRVTYTNIYGATISLEEIQGIDKLQELSNRIEEDNITDLWRTEKITYMQMEAAAANNDVIGNIIEKRIIQDLVLMYTITTTYDDNYIETVEITENYIRGG